MSTNIAFQSLRSGVSDTDSVWTDAVCHHVSGQVATVRHRRLCLSAPTSSTSRHAPHGRLKRDLHSLRAPHFPPPSPRRSPPRFGELSRPHHHIPSRAALPRHPLPRRPPLFLSRAPVRSHCQLRRELHLAGVHRDPRPRGQTSLVHLWP